MFNLGEYEIYHFKDKNGESSRRYRACFNNVRKTLVNLEVLSSVTSMVFTSLSIAGNNSQTLLVMNHFVFQVRGMLRSRLMAIIYQAKF